jgi:segregation and condensation protein B
MEGEQNQQALIEALILASGEPIAAKRLAEASKLDEAVVETVLKTITEKYSAETFGFELVNVAGQYQFRTKSQFAEAVRLLKGSLPRRLSAAALETLAIVAYRQPIVRSDIERIRGVDVTPTLKTLLERGLVRIVGHQSSVGQPALFGTTDEFLKLFGLGSLAELPTLSDLRELERDPGESGEGEAEEASSEETAAEEASADESAETADAESDEQQAEMAVAAEG